MSRLAELRDRGTSAQTAEKKSILLETVPTEPTEAPFVGFVGSISREIDFFSAPPEPKDRLCYQCQHFQRSLYGFPLGLCQQLGMPEGPFSDVRGNRIQHATSQPAKFGCVDFSLRAPDTNLCTACRHYHPVSTMCHVVNTGCPYPAIPPCTSAHFQPKEVAK